MTVMPLNSWSFINVASWVLAPTSSISDSSKDASATPPPLQSDWLTLNPWFMPLILAVGRRRAVRETQCFSWS